MQSFRRNARKPLALRAAIIAIIGSACTAAVAQYVQASGEFRSSSLSVLVVGLDPQSGVAAVETTVNQGACSGALAGIGKFEGRHLLVRPYVQDVGSATCELRIEFSKDWREVRTFARGCGQYSGSACGWEGQSARRR
jgi:hypothetical protein